VQGDNKAELDFGAVQRGDAEMEQKLNRVIRACLESESGNPICSIHDQGAGGNGKWRCGYVDIEKTLIWCFVYMNTKIKTKFNVNFKEYLRCITSLLLFISPRIRQLPLLASFVDFFFNHPRSLPSILCFIFCLGMLVPSNL
jgi:hypothetical protein